MAKEVLYSSQQQTGRYYGEIVKKEPHLKKEKVPRDPFDELFVKWYMKTGLFCKMDFNTFLDQPYWAMKEVTNEIDKRLEDSDNSILNYEHLALLLALARLFGGSK